MSVTWICGSIVLNALTFLAIYADTHDFDSKLLLWVCLVYILNLVDFYSMRLS